MQKMSQLTQVMKIYTLYIKEDEKDPLDSLEVIQEGFSKSGFFLNVIWLAYNQLWVHSIGCSLFLICMIKLVQFYGLPFTLVMATMGLVMFFIGLIGNDLICSMLEKIGYRLVDIVAASSKDEAVLKFISRSSEK
jgi:hypothetical protein